ncbi:MAG: response regulator [Pseudomonadales bacterium]
MEIHLRNMAVKTRSAANRHVLVVDDHIANLRLSALILEELGFHVHTATNGPDAVKTAEQENLQLIIMDVHMPVLDGLQATALIRESQGENLPIIGLSANVTSEDRTRLQSAGMNDVLTKPLNPAQLEGIIDTWLPRARRPDQANAVADTPTDNIPIFNPELALELANNNLQLANELFQLMITSLPGDQLKINEAWHRKKHDLFLENIHKLNGAARYCGIPRLARSIDQLESAIKSGTNEDIDTAIGIFNEEARCLLAWHLDNPDPLDPGTNAAAPPNCIP